MTARYQSNLVPAPSRTINNEMTTQINEKPFLIVMAMRGEAEPLIRELGLRAVPEVFGPGLPTLGYRGSLGSGREVYLLINGVDAATGMDMIGSQIATMTAVLGIRAFSPAAVFNFGTCGALSAKGAAIGDVYICHDRVWFHTHRIPVPGWDEYSKGGFPCPPVRGIAERHGFRTGVLSTSDSLDHPPFDAERFDRIGADMADMEGAAIAWMAHLHGLPYYGLKAVTDLMDLDYKAGEQFNANFNKVVGALTGAAVKLLNDSLEN